MEDRGLRSQVQDGSCEEIKQHEPDVRYIRDGLPPESRYQKHGAQNPQFSTCKLTQPTVGIPARWLQHVS